MTGAGGNQPVIVRGLYMAEKDAKQNINAIFTDFLTQIGRDILTGTFEDYDESIFPDKQSFSEFKARSAAAAKCIDERNDEEVREGRFRFRLELASTLFANPSYGFQRLIHTLASDLFERRIRDVTVRAQITDISFGALQGIYDAAYRARSHKISEIKQAFALDQDRPLLAFSLKPRACLSTNDYLHMVEEALDGGCQIVELDTRDLSLDDRDRDDLLVTLSERALGLSRERICRFSANLSGPAHVIKQTIERLSDVHARLDPKGPWVVKIDGNLDGLSTIQAIRSCFFKLHRSPVITCYPVLKYALQQGLGRDAFVKILAMSGADIIYPGQSPKFEGTDKRIDTQSVTGAQKHYKSMDLGGYPMLSVAGGVFVSSVHANMSVLGPNIAFFAGGGIALSKNGIRKGAQSFAGAVDLSCRDLFRGEKIKDLEKKFVELTGVFFDGRIPAEYDFVRPADLKHVERHKSASLE